MYEILRNTFRYESKKSVWCIKCFEWEIKVLEDLGGILNLNVMEVKKGFPDWCHLI